MKPSGETIAAVSRFSLTQAAMLGGVVAVAIFVVVRSKDGFDSAGAGSLLFWHVLVGAGAFALGAWIRNRFVR